MRELIEFTRFYAPVLNLGLILFVFYMGRRWLVRDRDEAKARVEILAIIDLKIDQKFVEHNERLLKVLREEFVTKDTCQALHVQVNQLSDIPSRVSRLEDKTGGNR